MKRRSFIQHSALGLAALSLPSCAQASKMKSPHKLGVALVGLGYYSGVVLGPAFQFTEHCELRGIVTGTPEKIPEWQKKYGIPSANIYNYDNFDQLANNDDIDVVYIVLPNTMHAEYAIKAAEAGKHVWCEKPMTTSVKDAQAIIDACRKNRVKLSIGYRMQHEPNTQTVIGWSKSKPFGNINELNIQAGFRAGFYPDNWKMKQELGGGAIFDMGTYPINAARYVTGEFPIAVKAWHETERKDLFKEVAETTFMDFEFPSGAMAKCMCTFGQSINVLEVKCAKGNYELKPFQSYEGVKGSASDGTLLNLTVENQQAKQMDDDALAIINNTEVLVPGEDGLADVRILEAVMKSAELGERVLI